jgi:peroxiredoxin
LPDARGGNASLEQLLREGPVALVFYRGQWCPYCDLALRAYQEVLPQIRALGAMLVAISPQTPDASLSTAEKRGLAFPVLSDQGNRVARSYGLVFTVAEGLGRLHQAFGIDLARSNGDASNELPVPGVFVVARGGQIAFAYVEADFRRRLEPAELLRQLERVA